MLKYLLLLFMVTSLLLGQMDFSEGGMNFGDSSSSFSKKKKRKKIYRKKRGKKKKHQKKTGKQIKKKKEPKNDHQVTFKKNDGGMNFGESKKEDTQKEIKEAPQSVKQKGSAKVIAIPEKKENKKEKNSGGMDFGNDSSGMNFGSDSGGMDFGEDSGGGMDFGSDSGGMDFGGDSSGMDFGSDSGGMDFGDDSKSMNFSSKASEEDDLLMDLEEDQNKIDEKKKKALAQKFNESVKTDKVVKEEQIQIVHKRQDYIEKGIFFRFTAGSIFLIDPKISGESGDEKDLFGSQLSMAVGFDFTKELSSELFVTLVSNGIQRRAEEDGILYNNDLNGKVVGLGVNYHFFSQNRFFMTGSLHGGILLLDSSLDDTSLKFAAGGKIGMEYYLLLRHFSVLVTAEGDYFTGLDTVGVSLTASIKYSF